MQLHRLKSICSEEVEFVFISGCQPALDDENPDVTRMQTLFPAEALTWYAKGDKRAPDLIGDYEGIDSAIDYLQTQLQAHAPIHGVLGFSQGSNIAAVLAAQAASGKGEPFAFVVHVCTTSTGWAEKWPELFRHPVKIPSLHIWGKQDACMGIDGAFVRMGQELPELYMDARLMSHSGDHRPLPQDRGEAEQLAMQILNFMRGAVSSK